MNHPIDNQPCLYCKSSENTFRSVEHIVPEGLGNTVSILPKGIVCDTCNHGVLARLDNILQQFEPLQFYRAFYGVKTKKGKTPYLNIGNIKMGQIADKYIQVRLPSLRSKHYVRTKEGFKLRIKGSRKYDDRYVKDLVRSLYKVSLGFIYHDHGPKLALSKHYDEVRDIIFGKDFTGYLAIPKKSNQDTQPTFRYRFFFDSNGERITVCEFYYHHLAIFYDLEKRRVDNIDGLKEKFIVLAF